VRCYLNCVFLLLSVGFQRSIYLFTKPIAADASSDAAAAAAAAAALTE